MSPCRITTLLFWPQESFLTGCIQLPSLVHGMSWYGDQVRMYIEDSLESDIEVGGSIALQKSSLSVDSLGSIDPFLESFLPQV